MTSPFNPIGGGSNGGNPFGPKPIVRSMFRSLAISASGLSAQRQRMDVVAENIANAETTHTDAGGPYKRKVVRMEETNVDAAGFRAQLESTGALANPALDVPNPAAMLPMNPLDPNDLSNGVRVSSIDQDNSEGPMVYEPGHPDADKNGYVRYPNVRITDEMVDMMDARRVYEANASVFQSAKAILKKSIDI